MFFNGPGIAPDAHANATFGLGFAEPEQFGATTCQYGDRDLNTERDILSDIDANPSDGTQGQTFPSLDNSEPAPWALLPVEAQQFSIPQPKRHQAESPRGSVTKRRHPQSVSQTSRSESTTVSPWNTIEIDNISIDSDVTYFSQTSNLLPLSPSNSTFHTSTRSADEKSKGMPCPLCKKGTKNRSDYK